MDIQTLHTVILTLVVTYTTLGVITMLIYASWTLKQSNDVSIGHELRTKPLRAIGTLLVVILFWPLMAAGMFFMYCLGRMFRANQ